MIFVSLRELTPPRPTLDVIRFIVHLHQKVLIFRTNIVYGRMRGMLQDNLKR
jgi:hypothetical protein